MAGVHEEPDAKPEDMEVDKEHTARKGRNSIGNAVLHLTLAGALETQPCDGANIALNNLGEEWVGHLWLFG